MQDASCPAVKNGRDGKTLFERLHGKKPTQEFVSCVRKYCHNKAPQIHKQIESQIVVRDLAWNVKKVECVIGNRDGVFRACESRRLERQRRWDKEAINNVIGVLLGNGRRQMDSGQTRYSNGSDPIPPLLFEGARIPRERITKQD